MQKFHSHFNVSSTPQNQAIPSRNDMVLNSARGYTFEASEWAKLDRFLILGTSGGSYYATEQKLTVESAEHIVELIKRDGAEVLRRTLAVSIEGRAYKNDPALFVMALIFTYADRATKSQAVLELPKITRTGTMLFTFVEYVNSMRGWGRGLRTAIANWYSSKDTKTLAYQVTKYKQRGGWSHRDLLRLCHAKTNEVERNNIYKYIVGKLDLSISPGAIEDTTQLVNTTEALNYLKTVEYLKKLDHEKPVAEIVSKYNMPREVVPDQWLNSTVVWEALLENMPMTAMIRNLAKMTRLGLVAPLSNATKKVLEEISNADRLHKARIHPIQILAALLTYKSGKSSRSGESWSPVGQIIDALDAAFYSTFKNVQPTGKNIQLAIDVSGSMGWGDIAGIPGLTPRAAAAAMALVTANVEPNCYFTAFCNKLVDFSISPRQRLDDVITTMSMMDFGATDCSLPMMYAMKTNIPTDAFVVLTDSETWAGTIHPTQALVKYRQNMNRPDACLGVVGMVANKVSIADPQDKRQMDFVGFDTNTPVVLSEFISGKI